MNCEGCISKKLLLMWRTEILNNLCGMYLEEITPHVMDDNFWMLFFADKHPIFFNLCKISLLLYTMQFTRSSRFKQMLILEKDLLTN